MVSDCRVRYRTVAIVPCPPPPPPPGIKALVIILRQEYNIADCAPNVSHMHLPCLIAEIKVPTSSNTLGIATVAEWATLGYLGCSMNHPVANPIRGNNVL